MKTLIFLIITLMASVCYGQVPVTKSNLLILVVGKSTCNLSRDADRLFSSSYSRQTMSKNSMQFIKICGSDTTLEWRKEYKVTHYPAIVYFMKDDDGNYQHSRTISGLQDSKSLGSVNQVQILLGGKAETYKASPPIQYVSPPQQYYTAPSYSSGGS